MLVEELPWGTDFDKPGTASEERRWHASPQSRFERLLRETGVAIGLLISPERIRLVYAPKGESSGHVTFPIHQMTMAANWPMLAALHLLLHSDRLFIGPDSQRLPAILEASRRYQNEVSIRLAGQVLRALNELVRGFQEADRAARGKILADALKHDPNHIYGGMLTTLMRMVFVLYAEDRSLMGSDETWLRNYSISGLYERLRADEGQYPDTMDSRYGAWAQIITLTRLLYDGGGHGSWRLPPRHGGLFDPDAYAFLEGRAWESKRDATALIQAPLVSDGILFRILQDLLYLDGERISYRALDVEQIGSVYEAMMGFTVETAHGISIGLGSDHLVVNLEELLAKKPADRPKWLKENADCEVTGKATERFESAASVDELLASLRGRISKLYLDRNSNPATVPIGGIYLQPTEERRRSGSHYTPRSLTQPIVKTTFDPVVAQLGDNPTPVQILALKVCDPAMGSGAFLVEACRYLGEKLEKAWISHDEMPPIPADQEPLLHARRIVAQRCLYGVDKNPFAVNLAKLSLWLATFAKDHPFTFVDHTLRCGDSLVGLTAHQVEAFHWQPKEEGALLRDLPSRLRHILNARAQIIDAAGETPYETLAQKLAVSDEQMVDLRLAGDLTIAAFFIPENGNERETRRKDLAEKFHRMGNEVINLELDDELKRTVSDLRTGPQGVKPFHWEIEFPEVFHGRSPGFDAIVGNPPFLGGRRLSTAFGFAYAEAIRILVLGTKGSSNLIGYFLALFARLARPDGYFGLVATSSVIEGETRSTTLRPMLLGRFSIIWARSKMPWPGKAGVHVVQLCMKSGKACGPSFLDERPVECINSRLEGRAEPPAPLPLKRNKPLHSDGVKVQGIGFVLGEEEAKKLFKQNERNSEVIWRYVTGEDLNSLPHVNGSRWVINFGDMNERQAREFAEPFRIIEDRVRQYRDGLTRQVHEACFWKFWDRREEFFSRCSLLRRVIVMSKLSKYRAVTFGPVENIYSEKVKVFASDDAALFGILQSQLHDLWSLSEGATTGETPAYSGTKCFDTFALPLDGTFDSIRGISGEYYEQREAYRGANNLGLTDFYNRFHDPENRDSALSTLRDLNLAMNRSVLDAYGWSDIPSQCEFLLDCEIGEVELGSKKKPWGYRWPDEVGDEVLTRLLELNRTRAEEERRSTRLTPATKAAGKRGRKSTERPARGKPSLFEVEE